MITSRFSTEARLAGVALLVLAACSCRNHAASPPGQPPPGATASAAPASAAVPEQPSLLEYVPEGAVGAVVVRRNVVHPLERLYAAYPGMQGELADYLKGRVGIDFTRIEGAVAYFTRVSPAARGAAVIVMPPDATAAIDLDQASRVLGLPDGVKIAVGPAGLIIGSSDDVDAQVALEQGKGTALSASSRLGPLAGGAARSADVAVALDAAAFDDDPSTRMVVAQYGIERMVVTISDDGLIAASLTGSAAGLKKVKALADAALAQAKAGLAQSKDAAKGSDDIATGCGAIIGSYVSEDALAQIAPRIEGGSLVSSYQFPRMGAAMSIVPMMGMLSAIAIPAFIKYIHRARAAEAN